MPAKTITNRPMRYNSCSIWNGCRLVLVGIVTLLHYAVAEIELASETDLLIIAVEKYTATKRFRSCEVFSWTNILTWDNFVVSVRYTQA